MSGKELKFNDSARREMLAGVNELANKNSKIS